MVIQKVLSYGFPRRTFPRRIKGFKQTNCPDKKGHSTSSPHVCFSRELSFPICFVLSCSFHHVSHRIWCSSRLLGLVVLFLWVLFCSHTRISRDGFSEKNREQQFRILFFGNIISTYLSFLFFSKNLGVIAFIGAPLFFLGILTLWRSFMAFKSSIEKIRQKK